MGDGRRRVAVLRRDFPPPRGTSDRSMTLLSERRSQRLAERAPITPVRRSRRLRYLPLTALVFDLLVVTAAALLAVIGRQRLGFFEAPEDVSSDLRVAGPLFVIGWVVAIWGLGGYRSSTFGAGTDEYKTVLNASLVAAGLAGVGCYLAK